MMVSITKEMYEHLLDRDSFLTCLEAAGVDNWDGYDIACQKYYRTHKHEQED